MEFYEAVNRRRTVREWSGEAVSEDVLKRVINAGLAAPTHNHLRSWEFVALRDAADKEKALQFVKHWAVVQGESKAVGAANPAQKMYAYAIPRQYSMLMDAAWVVIPLFKAGTGILQSSSVSGLNAFASIWCVIENMFLAAAAEGLACSMRIPIGTEERDVRAVIGAPEGYMMPCYIGLGHPAQNAPTLEQHHFTAEEKLHFGKW